MDEPDSSAWTRHVLSLFWPIRSRTPWGKPASIEAILAYLEMRGLDPSGLFDWICMADAEALAWMNEETEKDREQLKRSPQGRPTGPRRA